VRFKSDELQRPGKLHSYEGLYGLEGIVFPFIIWFYGSAIVIIRGWGCGFGNRREDVVAWSDNRPSFTVVGFTGVVVYGGI
jgi:hypothetical protein